MNEFLKTADIDIVDFGWGALKWGDKMLGDGFLKGLTNRMEGVMVQWSA